MAYNKNDFLAGVVAGRALHGRHIGSKGAPIHVEGNLNMARMVSRVKRELTASRARTVKTVPRELTERMA